MGQAGAQREPSMEEILASIRRIIESNEPLVQQQADIEDDAPVDPTAVPTHVVEQMAPDVVEPPISSARTPSVDAPVSLADVAARIRAEHIRTVDQHREDPAERDMRVAMLSDDNFVVLEAELVTSMMSPEPQSAAQRRIDGTDAIARDGATRDGDGARRPDAVPAAHQQDVPMQTAQPSSGQLVSVDTGAKVAASFDHLSEAVAAGGARTFDDIAEELLKPMLQSWLDDNLPTLVERLVREEIERVARGSRR